MPVISVVIVTYESELDILGCINSVLLNSGLSKENLEIIVVDNSTEKSAKKTKDLIVKEYGDTVGYVPMEKNCGYGAGNNFGIDICSAAIVCVMNPDVRLVDPLFPLANQIFHNEKNVAMVGFKQTGGKNISFYFYPEIFWPFVGAIATKIFNRLNFYSSKVFFLSGALVFIQKEKFKKVGGYDEKIFLYCEDSDLTKRFRKHGYGVRYSSDLIYEHRVDVLQRKDRSEESLTIEYESMIYYLKKHGFSKRWYYIKKLIEFRINCVIQPVLGRSSKAEVRKKFDNFARIFNAE